MATTYAPTHVRQENGRAALLLAFLALSFLVMGLHELTHHLAGRVVCGAWGEMSMSSFGVDPACVSNGRPWWLATLAGPALTFVLIAIGAAWRARWGLLLLFANLPLARLATAIGGAGDELKVARLALGAAAWPVTVALVAGLLAWPLMTAWRRLPRQRRGLVFTLALTVPLAWDFAFKRLFLAPLLPEQPVLAGVPASILLCDAIAAALVLALATRLPALRRA